MSDRDRMMTGARRATRACGWLAKAAGHALVASVRPGSYHATAAQLLGLAALVELRQASAAFGVPVDDDEGSDEG